jgi:hypothetical protein
MIFPIAAGPRDRRKSVQARAQAEYKTHFQGLSKNLNWWFVDSSIAGIVAVALLNGRGNDK